MQIPSYKSKKMSESATIHSFFVPSSISLSIKDKGNLKCLVTLLHNYTLNDCFTTVPLKWANQSLKQLNYSLI